MRDISSGVLAELSAQRVRPFVASQIEFADEVLNLWTGYGSIDLSATIAAPVVQTASRSQSVFANGTYYVKIARLFAGNPAQVSFESAAISIDSTHVHTISVSPHSYADGLRIYIGTSPGGESLYQDFFPTGNVFHVNVQIEQGTYLSGTVPSVNFIGVGNLGGIAPVTETTDLQANGVQLSLSGVPLDVLAESLSQCRQGMPVTLWLGFLDSSGNVIASPAVAFVGRMDTVSVDEGAETATITVTAESRVIDLQRPRIRRYTDDDQQRTNPGDLGFQYVPMVQDWNGSWGLHDRGH